MMWAIKAYEHAETYFNVSHVTFQKQGSFFIQNFIN